MLELLNKFDGLNVLIIGDVMVDKYMWGEAERISPEAPVPVVNVSTTENRLGGAANVALNVKALGATPYLCGVIGDDSDGTTFLELLKKRAIHQDYVCIEPYRMTTTKTRILARNQQIIRFDTEVKKAITDETFNQIADKFKLIIGENQIDVVIIQDYDKGLLDARLIQLIMSECHNKNIPVAVDPKKNNFSDYQSADLFKPNLREMEEGLKIEIDPNDLQGLIKASKKLAELLENKITMISLSDKGIFISDDTNHHLIEAHIRDVADVSGAGDTVISAAALSLAIESDIEKIAKLSNLAGGLVCEKVGVVPIDKDQLIREVELL